MSHFKGYEGKPNTVLVNLMEELYRYSRVEDYLLGFERHIQIGEGTYFPWAFSVMMLMPEFSSKNLIKPAVYDAVHVAAEKTRFCSFVFTNCGDSTTMAGASKRRHRRALFARLSKYKFVHAPGKCMHNFDDPDFKDMHDVSTAYSLRYHNSIEYFKKYKFVIAMENIDVDGYLTEKLPTAMLAGVDSACWSG